MNKTVKVAIIGGGPAGLAAAMGALEAGLSPRDILIIERDKSLGGILNQCIHAGFGLHRFGEELTGPEYADKYIRQVVSAGIPYVTDAMVLSLSPDKCVTYTSAEQGIVRVWAGAVVLAMGCRERTRGALNIPGTRPAGVYSAGTAQRFVNIDGYLPGRRVLILGSGDIGLIMARRMTLEGAKVLAVCELMPYSSGLARNIAQCLDDFDIPLYLSHTVVQVHGKDRVEGVTVARVGDDLKPIPGTEMYFDCDTLLLSCGLIPENEITVDAGIAMDRVTGGAVVDDHRQTSMPGVFACGNVLHVHDLVDFVSEESALAGACASKYVKGGSRVEHNYADTCVGEGVRYVVPQRFDANRISEATRFYLRVTRNYRNVYLTVRADGREIMRKRLLRAAPGEMEYVSLKGEALSAARECRKLEFAIEGDKEEAGK